MLEPLHETELPVDETTALLLSGGLDAGDDLIELPLALEQRLMSLEHEIIELHVLTELRQLFHAGHGALRAHGDEAAIRTETALDHLDQGGFAAAIDANETDVIPRSDLKRYIGEEHPFGELLPHLHNIHDSHTFPYAV